MWSLPTCCCLGRQVGGVAVFVTDVVVYVKILAAVIINVEVTDNLKSILDQVLAVNGVIEIHLNVSVDIDSTVVSVINVDVIVFNVVIVAVTVVVAVIVVVATIVVVAVIVVVSVIVVVAVIVVIALVGVIIVVIVVVIFIE